jgi:hypothetical protein
MSRASKKLTLSRETLRRLELKGRDATLDPDTSCVESCYFQSCDGGCGISEGARTAA